VGLKSSKKGYMKKVKTALFTLLLIAGVFGAILAFLRFKNVQKVKQFETQAKSIKELRKISSRLLKKWKDGATVKQWKNIQQFCPDLKIKTKVDSSFSRCNATFFNCVLKKEKYKFKDYGNRELYKVLSRQNSLEVGIPHFSIRTTIQMHKEEYHLDFEDSCRDVYLPQKNYGYRTEEKKRGRKFTWTWDNFDKNIFIDKFLVTNREVNEWIATMKKDIEKFTPPENPSVYLTKDQMKDYCHFKGKTLASAQVLEAASFYPTAGSDLPGGVLLMNDYPWTRRKSESFLYRLSKPKFEHVLKKEDCKRAYTRDCFEVMPFVNHKTTSSSWSGIFQTLGGPFEAIVNSYEKINLRASSFYFEGKTPVHKVGKKLYWDGIAHLDKNIEWKGMKPSGVTGQSLEIGFRCMKYVQN
jgi:hypothetical protein